MKIIRKPNICTGPETRTGEGTYKGRASQDVLLQRKG